MGERTHYTEKVVISLGGSLVVTSNGIAIDFLKNLNKFIRKQLADHPDRQFFIVVGGGATARQYIEAGRAVLEHDLPGEDLDWLGIHATRLNAHLIRTIFRDIAHPYLLKHYEIIRKVDEPVVIAAGWRPGWSTDYCAAMICEDYGVSTVINMSNIEKIYDQDPRTNPNAKPIDNITWTDFRKMVGDEWIPGMNVPFDPIASKKSESIGLKVVFIKGDNLANLQDYFDGKKFEGTVIEGK
jgi:uridylate kinase